MGDVIRVDFSTGKRMSASGPAKRSRRKGNFRGPRTSPRKSDTSFENQDGIISRTKGMGKLMLAQEGLMDYRFVGILIIHSTPLIRDAVVMDDCRILAEPILNYDGEPGQFTGFLSGLSHSDHMDKVVFAISTSLLAPILSALDAWPRDTAGDLMHRLLAGLSIYLQFQFGDDMSRYRPALRRAEVVRKLAGNHRLAGKLRTWLDRGTRADFAASVAKAQALRDIAQRAVYGRAV